MPNLRTAEGAAALIGDSPWTSNQGGWRFMMASKSTSAIDDGHRTQLTLTLASGTTTGRQFAPAPEQP